MLDDNNINHHNGPYVGTNNFWLNLFTFHEYILQNLTAQPLCNLNFSTICKL